MRSFGMGVSSVAIVLVLSGCGGRGDRSKEHQVSELVKPGAAAGRNLVLITIDTLRADHLGCYGDERARTPNIDALARDGIRFEQAISAVPITLPSHVTLMTGLDPPSHGVRSNGSFRLGPQHPTLAESLRARGYATSAVVAAFVLDARYGLNRGFDHYDDEIVAQSVTSHSGSFHARRADVVTAAATTWLKGHLDVDRRPFFLWAHYYDPHVPYSPPAELAAAFRDRPYDGEIAFVDAQIGVLLSWLRARGVLDDTLVVVTSDHGEGLGEHGEPTHMDLIYDSTLRVPLILSNPRLLRGIGVVDDRVAGLVDVLPTVLGLLGIDPPKGSLDGRNVTSRGDADRALYVESLAPYLDYGWAALHGLRTLRDKFILAPTPEYFDLRADPGELVNLHSAQPASRILEQRLTRRMAGWPSDAQARERGEALDEDARERLRSLGYAREVAPARPAAVNPETMAQVGSRIDRAVRLSGEGKTAEALREIESVLREFPDATRALYAATRIYDQVERLDEGRATLGRALALAPTSDGWVHMAWYAFQRRDFVAFDAALAQAERLDPEDGGIYVSRGHREALEGRLEGARAMFRKALEVDPVRSGEAADEAIRAVEAAIGRLRP